MESATASLVFAIAGYADQGRRTSSKFFGATFVYVNTKAVIASIQIFTYIFLKRENKLIGIIFSKPAIASSPLAVAVTGISFFVHDGFAHF